MRAKIELNVAFEPTEKGDFIGYIEEFPSIKSNDNTIEEVQNSLQTSLQFSKQTIDELKHQIVTYYSQKVDEEMNEIWDSKGMNEQTMYDILNTHV